MNDTVVWKDVPGYEGLYKVSSDGRVLSFHKHPQGKLLAPALHTSGYQNVGLYRNGSGRSWLVHQLVMLAFVGPPPVGTEINHKSGDKHDNRLENLEYVTHADNKRHAMTLPTHVVGERNGQARLTEQDVRQIKLLLRDGMKIATIARRYGVVFQTIGNIKTGYAWGHVSINEAS